MKPPSRWEWYLFSSMSIAAALSLHVVFCADGPVFFDRFNPRSQVSWAGAIGYATIGITISMGLAVVFHAAFGFRWATAIMLALMVGLAFRFASTLWMPQ